MGQTSEAVVDVTQTVDTAVQEFNETALSTDVQNVRNGFVFVQCDSDYALAQTRILTLKAKEKEIKEWWEPVTKPLWAAARAASAKCSEFLKPVEQERADQEKEARRYKDVIRPATILPNDESEAPKVEGLQERQSPAKVRVTDLRAVLRAALDNETVYGWLAEVLIPAVESALADPAKRLDKELPTICPGVEVYRETYYAKDPQKKPTESVQINRIAIEGSSQILEAGFCDGLMEVTFKKKDGAAGDTWNYHGVPADVFAGFLIAESKGKYLVANIKGKYQGVKVNKAA